MAISPDNAAWRTAQDNRNARLTNAHVRAARFLRADYKMTVDELARMYGVSRACMSGVLSGQSYVEAGGPLTPRRTPPGTWAGKKRPHRRT